MNKIFDDKWKKKPSKKELYDLINCYTKEIERLNKAFDNLEQVINYYVIGNLNYDDVTAKYILNRLLQFRALGSGKE